MLKDSICPQQLASRQMFLKPSLAACSQVPNCSSPPGSGVAPCLFPEGTFCSTCSDQRTDTGVSTHCQRLGTDWLPECPLLLVIWAANWSLKCWNVEAQGATQEVPSSEPRAAALVWVINCIENGMINCKLLCLTVSQRHTDLNINTF